MNNDEKYYAVGMPVRYAWGGPGPDNIRTGTIVENSDFIRGFYVIKDDRNGEKYNIVSSRILGYNTTDILEEDIKEYVEHDEETLKDFMNRIYGKSDFIQHFMLGDLVMYKDTSKPEIFTVIEIIEYKDPIGQHISYSYRIKRTARDGQDIVNFVDHDRLVKVDKQYRGGGYIYPVGTRVRFKFGKNELIGYIQERYQDGRYEIRADEKTYVIIQDHILGYSAKNWIDDPSIRKAFGLDVNKNDIYENIKKQINKDQLNFHYGLRSIFPLAPNDAAVPFELSEKEKEYVRNDVASTMSYIHELHKNGFYGTGADTKIVFDEFVNKEDNMKNTKLIRCNGTYKKEVKKVIFSGPVTTIVFEDELDIPYGRVIKSKTNVRCQEGDEFNKTTGYLLALLKTFVDKQSYDNILRTIDSFEEDSLRKEWNENIINPDADKVDNWKFMIGDLVRLKSGNVIFKVVRTCTWKIGDRIIHRYAIQRLGGSKYITYENENRLTLVEPTTGRLMKSIIKE